MKQNYLTFNRRDKLKMLGVPLAFHIDGKISFKETTDAISTLATIIGILKEPLVTNKVSAFSF